MKQNSSILFHPMRKSLKNGYFGSLFAVAFVLNFFLASTVGVKAQAVQSISYATYFDPAKGFKPAQADFAQIFLQLAGSLEYYGSPEPYLRHMVAEHSRIDALYHKATGKSGSSRPAYFTDDYLENLVDGWNKLAPVLKLDALSRLAGRDMRYAILGSWNKSTPEIVEHEINLTDSEKTIFRHFMERDYFTRANFPELDAFYKEPYEKLTEEGKSQLSTRIHLGMLPPPERNKAIADNKGGTVIMSVFREHQQKTLAYMKTLVNPQLPKAEKVNSDSLENALINRLKLNQEQSDSGSAPSSDHDALLYSHDIKNAFQKRFDHVKMQSPEQSELIEKALISMVDNLVVVAQSEYEASLYNALSDHIRKGEN